MVETRFLVDILTIFSSEVRFSRIRKIQVSQGIDEEFNTRITDVLTKLFLPETV